MEQLISKIARSAGFSVVEVLLATTIFGFMVTAVIGAVVYGQASADGAGERARAVMLADEAVEAVTNIRDSGYNKLIDGTYGLVKSGGSWMLSGSSDTAGIYTRRVVISTPSTDRKNITVTVSWVNGAATRTVSVSSRLTNWQQVSPATWANASQAGGVDIAGTNDPYYVATQGDYAYVVFNTNISNFVILDISDPAAPTVVRTLSLAADPNRVFTYTVGANTYAYVTTTNNSAELQIVNVTNPASASLVGTFNASGNTDAHGIKVITRGVNTYALITRVGSGGMQVVNVNNPALPTLAGNLALSGNYYSICTNGNYAYVLRSNVPSSFSVVNLTTPTAPSLGSTVSLASSTIDSYSIKCSGNRLYASSGTRLYAYNITTPTAPALLGSVVDSPSGTIYDMDVNFADNYAYLGTGATSAEFQVVNLENPAAMTIARVVDMAGNNSIYGLAYNSSLDIVAAGTTINTQELVTFKPNP